MRGRDALTRNVIVSVGPDVGFRTSVGRESR